MDNNAKNATVAEQRTWPMLLRRVGIALFLLSLVTPPRWSVSNGFDYYGGLVALIETPAWALIIATQAMQEGDWQEWLLAVCLIIGWFSNFWILIRMPLVATLFAIASPWILFVGVTFLESVAGISTTAIEFIPFYPWAIGILLIHLSRLAEPDPERVR